MSLKILTNQKLLKFPGIETAPAAPGIPSQELRLPQFLGIPIPWEFQSITAFYIHYTIAMLYFGEIRVCSICCQKLVRAHKYLAKVRPNFGTRSAPSANTSASAEHYKGMFGAPLTAMPFTG